MARNLQVRRQWRLWVLLCAGPAARSARELAASLALDTVTPRTVRRDLELLRSIGVPVREIREGRSTRYCARGDGPDLRLDGDALLALRLFLGILRPYEGTPIGASLEQLLTRLEAQLPPKLLAHFGPLCEGLAVRLGRAPSYAEYEPIFSTVRSALQERRRLALEYQARDGTRTSRCVHPQGLLHGPRGLYLLALDESRNSALRTFRLERILSVHADGATSVRDTEFDPDRNLAGSLGVHSPEHPPRRFRIRIHGEAAALDLRECPLHASQALEEERTGTWILHLTLESTRELVPMILAFGESAEVMEPASPRSEVAGILRGAAARYGRVAASGRGKESRSRSVRVVG